MNKRFRCSTSTKWFFVYLIHGHVGFLRSGENWSSKSKISPSKGENQHQTQPTYGVVVILSPVQV